jgi:DNA-binding response OmpR family regulator
MNILIIEDDKLTLKSLQYCIESLGHKAFAAEDAETAINLVVEGNFDLLISDVMMPGISGLSLVSVLRSVHFSTIPIVMMSTLNNKSLLEAAIEAGANDFMSKPFSPEDLEKVINKFDKHTLVS